VSTDWELELRRRAAKAEQERDRMQAQLANVRRLLSEKDEQITQLTRGRPTEKVLAACR
jgi:hypothetical protein